jgi:ferritin
MLSKKIQDAINEQINVEMWSANLYLSMSLYFAKVGFSGFSAWMKAQSKEELGHAYSMIDYVIKRGGTAYVGRVDSVPTDWKNPLDVFESVYNHEVHISGLIDKLVDVAAGERDKASQDFLWGFVREQVEEEATSKEIVDRVKMAGDNGIFYIDAQLGQRK